MSTPSSAQQLDDTVKTTFKLNASGFTSTNTTVIPTASFNTVVTPGSDELFTSDTAVNINGEAFTLTSLASEPGLLTLTKYRPDGTQAWTIPKLSALTSDNNTYPDKTSAQWMSKGIDMVASTADGGVLVAVTGERDWRSEGVINMDWFSANGAKATVPSIPPRFEQYACIAKYTAAGSFAGWVISYGTYWALPVSGLVEGSNGDVYVAVQCDGLGDIYDSTGQLYSNDDYPGAIKLTNRESPRCVLLRFNANGEFVNRVGITSDTATWENYLSAGLLTAADGRVIWATRDNCHPSPQYKHTMVQRPILDMSNYDLKDTVQGPNLEDAEFMTSNNNGQALNRTVVAAMNNDLTLEWASYLMIYGPNTAQDEYNEFITASGLAHTAVHPSGDISLYVDTYITDNIVYVSPSGTKTRLAFPAMTSPVVGIVLRLDGATGAFINITFVENALTAFAAGEKRIATDAYGLLHVAYNSTIDNAVVVASITSNGALSTVSTGNRMVTSLSSFDSDSTAWNTPRTQFGFLPGAGIVARLEAPLTLTDTTATISMPRGVSVTKLAHRPFTVFNVPHSALSAQDIVAKSIVTKSLYVADDFLAEKHIRNGVVTTAKIADGSITPSKFKLNEPIVYKLNGLHLFHGTPQENMVFDNMFYGDGSGLVTSGTFTLTSTGSVPITYPWGYVAYMPKKDVMIYTDTVPGVFEVSNERFATYSSNDVGGVWRVYVNGADITGDLQSKATSPKFILQPNDTMSVRLVNDVGVLTGSTEFYVSRCFSPLPDNLVWSNSISSGAITGPKIAAYAVSTDKVADGAITAAKLHADARVSTKVYTALTGTWAANSALAFDSPAWEHMAQSAGTFTVARAGVYQLVLTRWTAGVAWRVDVTSPVNGASTSSGTGLLSLTLDLGAGDTFSVKNASAGDATVAAGTILKILCLDVTPA